MRFVEILRRFRIPYKETGDRHCRPGWIQLQCPFCLTGKWHLGFNISSNYLHCYKCGYHPLKSTILMMVTNVSNRDVMEAIESLPISRWVNEEVPIGYLQEPETEELMKCHVDYLQKERGYNPVEIQKLWKVRGIGQSLADPRLAWSIYIPIIYRDKVVSWTTRSIGKGKYISASPQQESVPHKQILYGEDYCHHQIIVCEGPFDVWRIGPGAVATFGTSVSPAQLKAISKYPVRAICFDKDAYRQSQNIASKLSVLPGETYCVALDSSDPGDASPDEVKELRTRFLGE